ncbi:hypothetical protein C8E86_2652 [Catellatospora citrea]|nr:hypothetical protein C8E86_2652 [Catellatospora citrea]
MRCGDGDRESLAIEIEPFAMTDQHPKVIDEQRDKRCASSGDLRVVPHPDVQHARNGRTLAEYHKTIDRVRGTLLEADLPDDHVVAKTKNGVLQQQFSEQHSAVVVL